MPRREPDLRTSKVPTPQGPASHPLGQPGPGPGGSHPPETERAEQAGAAQGPGYSAARTGPDGHDLAQPAQGWPELARVVGPQVQPSMGEAPARPAVADGAGRGLVPSAKEPAPRVAVQQRVEGANLSRDVSGRVANVPRVAETPPVGDEVNVAECLKALARVTDAGSLASIAATAKGRCEAAEAAVKAAAAEKRADAAFTHQSGPTIPVSAETAAAVRAAAERKKAE